MCYVPSVPTNLPERIAAFYRRVGDDPDGALATLAELYHPEVVMTAPIAELDGLPALEAGWRASARKYAVMRFDHVRVVGTDEHFFAAYDMVVQFTRGPPLKTPTAMELWGRDGKVYRQVDYWETVGSALQVVRPLQRLYMRVAARALM
jgi:ketosteroid isomerase-like protein